jgi:hypothetical protein
MKMHERLLNYLIDLIATYTMYDLAKGKIIISATDKTGTSALA